MAADRDGFIIALALLCGAEIKPWHRTTSWLCRSDESIGGSVGTTKVTAAEHWLKTRGIRVSPTLEVTYEPSDA